MSNMPLVALTLDYSRMRENPSEMTCSPKFSAEQKLFGENEGRMHGSMVEMFSGAGFLLPAMLLATSLKIGA